MLAEPQRVDFSQSGRGRYCSQRRKGAKFGLFFAPSRLCVPFSWELVVAIFDIGCSQSRKGLISRRAAEGGIARRAAKAQSLACSLRLRVFACHFHGSLLLRYWLLAETQRVDFSQSGRGRYCSQRRKGAKFGLFFAPLGSKPKYLPLTHRAPLPRAGGTGQLPLMWIREGIRLSVR
ncbi:MAG: hypothetical protein D6730_08390 [Bacteroidetes bacterium]|nr:MAG: hypothetical protein D6730_08390 [Bacteroidota bacterium]